MSKSKFRRRKISEFQAMVWGAVVSFIILLGLLLGMSAAVSEGKISETIMKPAGMTAVLLSVAVGGLAANILNKKISLKINMGIGGIIALAVMVAGTISGKGMPINSNTPLVAAICALGALIASIGKMKKRRIRRA